MNLIESIHIVGTLDYDTLRDIRDKLDYQAFDDQIADTNNRDEIKRLAHTRNLIRLRIRGRHSRRDGRGKRWDDIQYPIELRSIPDMNPSDRAVLLATVKQLINAKLPKAGQRSNDNGRVARGTFQTKTKKNAFIVRDEDGKPMRDENDNIIRKDAHYLYFRIYTTNHDGTSRNASIYIGSLNRQEPKPFLQAVVDALDAEENEEPVQDYMITRDDLMDMFERGGYELIKDERQSMDDYID